MIPVTYAPTGTCFSGNAHMGDFLTIRQLAHRRQQIGNAICAEHIGTLRFPGVHDAEYLSGKID